MYNFWQLPSLANLCNQIDRDIEEGLNVIFSLPLFFPRGLDEAISKITREQDKGIKKIEIRTNGGQIDDPVIFLSKYFGVSAHKGIFDLQNLVESEQFPQCSVFLIDGLDEQNIAIWIEFLKNYGHSCRAISEFSRSIFCFQLKGPLCAFAPENDVTLVNHKLSGVLNRLDSQIIISQLLQGKSLHSLHQKLFVSIILELGTFDYNLIKYLIGYDLDTLLKPTEILIEFAKSRGWNLETSIEWEQGLIDYFDGENQLHSAILAIQGNVEEIQKRIWIAQVGIIFPYIEQQRIAILKKSKHIIKVPFQTDFKIIDNMYDLEISHIFYMVKNSHFSISTGTYNLLRCLCDMRNSIAHLEPISIENLNSKEVLKSCKRF